MRHAAEPSVDPHTAAAGHAWRAFVTGLVVDVAVAAALFTAQAVGQVSDRTSLTLFAVALLKTVLSAAGAYVARRLLPAGGQEQAPQGEPAPVGAAPMEPAAEAWLARWEHGAND